MSVTEIENLTTCLYPIHVWTFRYIYGVFYYFNFKNTPTSFVPWLEEWPVRSLHCVG